MTKPRQQQGIDPCALRDSGWASSVTTPATELVLQERMLALAPQLGRPVATRPGANFVDRLMPREGHTANPRSLSRIYSIGEFPLHVDTAHWLTPCRYVMLACVCPGRAGRPTLLLDPQKLQLEERHMALLQNTPLRVTNGRHSFFSTILSRSRQFVRYDPGCMTAVTPDGAEALAVFSRCRWSDFVEEIKWEPGQVIVLDNWRLLRGRGQAKDLDSDRILLRLSIP